MSRIDELIAELAPDGVPHRSLGEIGEFIRGNGLQKSDLTDAGVPAIHYGQVHTIYGVWTTQSRSFTDADRAARLRKAQPGDLVIATTSEDDEAVAKATAWLGTVEAAVSGDAYIFRHSVEPKYVAYFFQSRQFHDQKARFITGTKVRRISGDNLAKIRIPVPPLEVQREIVRILDQFTQLEAEVEAELEARRAQYAYYRSHLLESDSGGERVTLSAIFDVVPTPRGIQRSLYNQGSKIPIIDQGQDLIAGYTDDTSSIVSCDGLVVFGDHTRAVKWVDFDFAPGADGTKVLRAKDGIIPRYAYFLFSNADIPSRGYNRHWTVARELHVTLQPIDEQLRIVRILDQFDALVNDLKAGLPTEIKARRKQYEYYRDKLLAFEELD